MQIIYDTLFKVALSHNYYDSDNGRSVADDLEISPTAACLRSLKNYGLLFKKNGQGFSVLYEAEKGEGDALVPRRTIEEPVRFSFVVKTRTPWFLNFSQLPIPEDGPPKIYRVHNRQDNQQGGELLLTADYAAEFLSEKDRIEVKPLLFHERFETEDTHAEMQVVSEKGDLVADEKVFPVEKAVDFVVDLKKASPGKYTLKKNGTKIRDFYADDELIGENVFAVIDIFDEDSVSAAYRFTDENHSVAPKTYKIKIDNRKVFWKYLVVLKYRTQIDTADLSVALSGNGSAFSKLPDTVLSNGLTAAPFVSNDEMGLTAKPVKGIKLTCDAKGTADDFEIANLPNGRPETIKPDKDEDKIYSEIYIYV